MNKGGSGRGATRARRSGRRSSSILTCGAERFNANDVGLAAAELIRIYPNDRWDVVVGDARFTADGLKVPLSGIGAGFEDENNTAFWAMNVFDDVLYVGTHHCQSFRDALSEEEVIGGGLQLWATRDGEAWEAVTMDGFDDPFSTGVRTLLPPPFGLFLGISTHREVQQRWSRRTGRPIQVPGSGLSVWLGRNATTA